MRFFVVALVLGMAGLVMAAEPMEPRGPDQPGSPGSGPGGPGTGIPFAPIEARTSCSDAEFYQVASSPGLLYPSDTVPHYHDPVTGDNVPFDNTTSDVVWEWADPAVTQPAGEAFVGYFDIGDYPIGGGVIWRGLVAADCIGTLRYQLPANPGSVTAAELSINGFNGALWAVLGVELCKTVNPLIPHDGDGDGTVQQPSPGGCIVSGRNFTDFNFVDTHDLLLQEALDAGPHDLVNSVNAAALDFATQAGPFTETITLSDDIVEYIRQGGNQGVVDFIVRITDVRGNYSEGPAGTAALTGYPSNIVIIEDRNDVAWLAGGSWATDLVLY